MPQNSVHQRGVKSLRPTNRVADPHDSICDITA